MRLKMRDTIFRVVSFSILILGVCIFGLQKSFAVSAPFEIANVEVSQKSETATGGVTGIDGNRVNNDIVFHKVGDSVTYKIKIKNVGNSERIIDNISSNYQGELFDYEFESYAGESVVPGESFDFVLKTTYKKAVSDVSKRQQNLEIKFVFKFSDGSEMDFIIVNPSTWDNISVFGVLLIVSVAGLIGLIIFRLRKVYPSKKVIAVGILLAVACVPMSFVKAEDGVYDVSIVNAISLRDELVIRYMSEDGTEELKNETVAYGDNLQAPTAPSVDGYYFEGWMTEQGNLYDFSMPAAEDMVLKAKYAPYTYSVHFDGNGAEDGSMNDQVFTYDEPAVLSTNSFARAGYNFMGWNTLADGSGKGYTDGELVKNLRKEPGVYNLFAIWQARNDTRYTVVDKFMNVAGDGYDSIERLPITTIGTTDTDVTPTPLTREGFVTPDPQTKKIAGDGSMRIEYEYVRVQKQLTIQNAQYVTSSHASGKYNYGTVVTLKANDRDEYIFDKWSNGSTEKEITVTLTEDVTIGPEYRATDFPLVYSHDGACTFNGNKESADGSSGALEAGDITGAECADYAGQKYIDTGVQLYTETNAHKDFYIEFTIDEFDLSKNASRATMLNVTQERETAQYPGIVVRRNDTKDEILVGVNVVRDRVKKANFKKNIKPASSVTRVRLVRKNDIICYAINDGDYIYAGDNTLYNQYFEMPNVIFGASINEQGVTSPRVERYLNGTLSGMKVRLGKDTQDTINCTKP
jgi:hypothetical protein